MRLTVGNLPSTVYWRRRVIVLGVVLVTVLLLAYACGDDSSRAESGTEKKSTKATPSHTASRAASPTPTSSAGAADWPGTGTTKPPATAGSTPNPTTAATTPCADADISISTSMSPSPAPSGSYPTLYLTVGNTTKHPCTRDVGADQQELRIMKGTQRLWSSDDCNPNHGADVRTFRAGDKVSFHLVWAGKSSAPGCTGARTVLPPGTYQLIGRLGTKLGTPATFRLS